MTSNWFYSEDDFQKVLNELHALDVIENSQYNRDDDLIAAIYNLRTDERIK